jgi:hypothetical protein
MSTIQERGTGVGPHPGQEVRREATLVERKAWILLALISAVIVAFGLMMLLGDPPEEITGSQCCAGRLLSDATPWMVDYATELARYMGIFAVGLGILALTLVLVPFRRRERWSWFALWYLPALFAWHGFVLGSFPFDIVPLTISLLGLMLSARLFFGAPAAAESHSR